MATKNKTVVEYVDQQKGLTTREFSHDIHGEDHEQIAADFAEKFDGTVLSEGEKTAGEEEANPETSTSKPRAKAKKTKIAGEEAPTE